MTVHQVTAELDVGPILDQAVVPVLPGDTAETLEPMTLYRALYGQRGLWVRPAAMFEEQVLIDGALQPRFQKCAEGTAPV